MAGRTEVPQAERDAMRNRMREAWEARGSLASIKRAVDEGDPERAHKILDNYIRVQAAMAKAC